ARGVDRAVGQASGTHHRHGQRGVQDDGPSSHVHGRNFGPTAGATFGGSWEFSVEPAKTGLKRDALGEFTDFSQAHPSGDRHICSLEAPTPPAASSSSANGGCQAPSRGGGRPYRRPGRDQLLRLPVPRNLTDSSQGGGRERPDAVERPGIGTERSHAVRRLKWIIALPVVVLLLVTAGTWTHFHVLP